MPTVLRPFVSPEGCHQARRGRLPIVNESDRLMQAMARYSLARREFLAELGLGRSNRDPLAEFSEGLVAALLGGTLATSRVQRGHDLVAPRYGQVQVRYLANPPGPWINEHSRSPSTAPPSKPRSPL